MKTWNKKIRGQSNEYSFKAVNLTQSWDKIFVIKFHWWDIWWIILNLWNKALTRLISKFDFVTIFYSGIRKAFFSILIFSEKHLILIPFSLSQIMMELSPFWDSGRVCPKVWAIYTDKYEYVAKFWFFWQFTSGRTCHLWAQLWRSLPSSLQN